MILIAVSIGLPAAAAPLAEFRSAWPEGVERVWVGPEYWANRLQDWRTAAGRLECTTSGGNRTIGLLTRQIGPQAGDLRMSVRLGRLTEGKGFEGWVGFRIGAKGRLASEATLRDGRDDAVRGVGLDLGLTADGRLFIGRDAPEKTGDPAPSDPRRAPTDDVELRMSAAPADDTYTINLSAYAVATGSEIVSIRREGVPATALAGGIALVCHHEPAPPAVDAKKGAAKKAARPAVDQTRGNLRFWFKDWRVGGSKLTGGDEQVFGPILWTQYTLSRNVLKMTAQFPPIGAKDSQDAHLEVRDGEAWKRIASARIDALARTATFRIEKWESARDIPYRVAYALVMAGGSTREFHWEGTVRRDPVDKEVIAVAGFTGNADYAWPNVDLVAHLKKLDPDLLFFSGDNIYENVGGYGIERSPLERACLDYLRKWYFYGWSFRDLLRDRPCVSIPDDHDVYHPNLWGQGGRKTDKDDKGGYTMDAEWVKMVERTQTSHLPDPFDPTPIEQGIGVYYSPMTYGRISFAIIEDRKFKTGPSGVVPPTTTGRADHENRPDFDPKRADVAGAQLLGDRQLAFLRDWAADWRGADFKVVLSQTIFCGAATHHGAGLVRLRMDYDSNGWPQTGRNKALDEMRRGFAFHLAGDQHLATLIHHGIDDWDDAAWSLCVPSITNFYLRAWRPEPEMRRAPLGDGMPEYTGRFFDGLGNRISVWAATNPGKVDVPPAWLHDQKPGFGLIRLDKKADTIAIECWPRYADPTDPKARQFEGWPKTIHKLDNYGRKAAAHLPVISVKGMENPVVQIIDEDSGEIIYTVRIRATRIRPKVFREGTYTMRIGEQPDRMKTLTGVKAPAAVEVMEVEF